MEIREENERKKEYLRKYRSSVRRVKSIEEEIERLRMDKMFPSVVNDDMPHGNEQKDLSDYVVLLDEQIEKLKKERYNRIKLYSDIMDSIRELEDDIEQDVLKMKYIDGKSFEEIAVELGYTYRHVTRIHGNALFNFKINNDVLLCP